MLSSAPPGSLVRAEQFCDTNPWPKRTSSLPDVQNTSRSDKVNKCIMVAISGCSSSGKTTLAVLLAEMFSVNEKPKFANPQIMLNNSTACLIATSLNKESQDLNQDKKQPRQERSTVEEGGTIIIHQDAYFLDKSSCPLVTFTSTPADVGFIEQTLVNDTIGTYILSWVGSRIKGNINHSNNASDSTNAYADGWKPVPPVWRITGPDTDCWPALDIPSLILTIKDVGETGSLSESALRRDQETALKFPGLLISASERDSILLEHYNLIIQMKNVVKDWIKHHAITNAEPHFEGLNIKRAIETNVGKEYLCPSLCFIEGFLLFPNPASLSNGPSSDSNKTSHSSRIPENKLGDEQGTPDERTAFRHHESQQAVFQTLNAEAREKLMGKFDVKLFLSTSKEKAQERRLVRDCYIDAPAGKRIPGQLWKTDGYFEEVVWENYVKENGWLFEDGAAQGKDSETGVSSSLASDGAVVDGCSGVKMCIASDKAKEMGVHVRPGLDAGISDTIHWAVGVILEELGKKVCYDRAKSEFLDATGQGPGHDNQYDHYGDTGKPDKSSKKCSTKEKRLNNKLTGTRNIVHEKITTLKGRFFELFNVNKTTEDGIHGGAHTEQHNRQSISSVLKGKGEFDTKRKGKALGDAKTKDKAKNKDVGLKTVLGSGNADRGFFSPKL